MKTSINYEIIHQICGEVAAVLENFILDDPESFPYTMNCVHFMENLANKGKKVSFNHFDSEIIDSVYQELGDSLKH